MSKKSSAGNTANSKTLSLAVEIPYTRDLYQGVARVDYDSMDALDASTGSIIEIIGKKRTVARILPLYPSDDGKGLIRIDELTKENAGATAYQSVTLRKISSMPAGEVTVIPLEPVPLGSETYLRDYLEGQPLTKGQKLILPYFREWLEYKVKEYSPSYHAVVVTSKTKFHVSSSPKENTK